MTSAIHSARRQRGLFSTSERAEEEQEGSWQQAMQAPRRFAMACDINLVVTTRSRAAMNIGELARAAETKLRRSAITSASAFCPRLPERRETTAIIQRRM